MTNEQDYLPSRAGQHYRSNPERYFHVMTEGWFIFTREGIRGPFIDMPKAKGFLEMHLKDLQSDNDPSATWRL